MTTERRIGAVEALLSDGEATRERELARALDRLDAAGELTPEREAALEALSNRLVERLLAPPTESLCPTGDEASVDAVAVIELFDIDTAETAPAATDPQVATD